jgi:hypothetical protein
MEGDLTELQALEILQANDIFKGPDDYRSVQEVARTFLETGSPAMPEYQTALSGLAQVVPHVNNSRL